MGKRKTKKGVAKRFRMMASGLIKRSKAGKRHLLGGKSRKRKRALRAAAVLSPMHQKQITQMLVH